MRTRASETSLGMKEVGKQPDAPPLSFLSRAHSLPTLAERKVPDDRTLLTSHS